LVFGRENGLLIKDERERFRRRALTSYLKEDSCVG
jgi:hypothetical protein